ncbi:MAG: hypothetical protein EA417_19435 [Gammaproteobacteria bacterium]|nr:MAG: hypothetical protein EA417_19435 [Gammaproteobacteria bacterium]
MAGFRILFILASNHAGSHLLAERLAADPQCLAVGELANLRKFLGRRGPSSSGTDSSYGSDPLYAGLSALPETVWHQTIWERRGRQFGTLIDNSKRLDWLCRTRDAAASVHVVHLLRDPRAFVHRVGSILASDRALRTQRWRECRRQLQPRLLWASRAEVFAWRWLRENRGIADFLLRQDMPAARVSYEELIAAPKSTVERLFADFGLPSFQLHEAHAAIAASPTFKPAWRDQGAAPEPDLRWLEELSQESQAAVLELAPLRAFLAGLGYRMGPEGLMPLAEPVGA